MSIAYTMPHCENGVCVDFSNMQYFQFENCQGYIAIKSHGVKEMDFGLQEKGLLWLIELKSYFDLSNPKHQSTDISRVDIFEEKLEKFTQKAIHSLAMLFGSRINTQSCLKKSITKNTRLKLVYIVSVESRYTLHLQPLGDKLRQKLKPYIALYNIDSVTVLDYTNAKKSLKWVV